jgi:hypothetical protein
MLCNARAALLAHHEPALGRRISGSLSVREVTG